MALGGGSATEIPTGCHNSSRRSNVLKEHFTKLLHLLSRQRSKSTALNTIEDQETNFSERSASREGWPVLTLRKRSGEERILGVAKRGREPGSKILAERVAVPTQRWALTAREDMCTTFTHSGKSSKANLILYSHITCRRGRDLFTTAQQPQQHLGPGKEVGFYHPKRAA